MSTKEKFTASEKICNDIKKVLTEDFDNLNESLGKLMMLSLFANDNK